MVARGVVERPTRRLFGLVAPFLCALTVACVLKTLAAIDAKDADRLFQLGGEIDAACEACHVVFWYPPDLIKN